MLRIIALLCCLLSAGCATRAHFVATDSNRVLSTRQVAHDLAKADVVVLGEQHDATAVHELHLALLKQLHARRGDVVLALEMFERDVQPVLMRYLNDLCTEAEFLAQSRPWPNYASDYRPMVEFAKANSLPVLAANAPRPLASRVAKQGIESVQGEPHVARSTSAPEDGYWQSFLAAMQGHVGTGSQDAIKRMYAAQCLKDDTMAETVVDHLRERQAAGARPLVVLVVGKGHSDHRLGVVSRVQDRMPGADVRVLSCVTGSSARAARREVVAGVGDYVICAAQPAKPEEEMPVRTPRVGAVPTHQPAAAATEAEANPEGQRPALGLMPDYAAGAEGLRVESVREDGPAAVAGIQAGDIIVSLGGRTVTDMESYTEALGAQRIGRLVPVRVRRGEIEVEFQVKVASRSR
jgi:uncharacterized iron-regulated protein